jgi:hypothetical protein
LESLPLRLRTLRSEMYLGCNSLKFGEGDDPPQNIGLLTLQPHSVVPGKSRTNEVLQLLWLEIQEPFDRGRVEEVVATHVDYVVALRDPVRGVLCDSYRLSSRRSWGTTISLLMPLASPYSPSALRYRCDSLETHTAIVSPSFYCIRSPPGFAAQAKPHSLPGPEILHEHAYQRYLDPLSQTATSRSSERASDSTWPGKNAAD